MNTTKQFDSWESLTLWETGMYVGLDAMDVLALAEDGLFPAPVSPWPLRWAEQDVCRWWHAKQTEGRKEC